MHECTNQVHARTHAHTHTHTHTHTHHNNGTPNAEAHNRECLGMAHNRCTGTGKLAQRTIREGPSTQLGSNEDNQLNLEQMDKQTQPLHSYKPLLKVTRKLLHTSETWCGTLMCMQRSRLLSTIPANTGNTGKLSAS